MAYNIQLPNTIMVYNIQLPNTVMVYNIQLPNTQTIPNTIMVCNIQLPNIQIVPNTRLKSYREPIGRKDWSKNLRYGRRPLVIMSAYWCEEGT